MTKIRQRKYLLAILALVLIFAGCKGESPTSPTTTPPSGGTGGVTPPTTASVSVTISNATPLVDSTTVITASVTIDNQPAPNGTAVEFKTTLGTFTDANAPITIRTTTNGVATATLTSASAGTATITATVNNVARSTSATFALKPVTPTPPDTTPSITSVTPTTLRPAGGETITIIGKNFVVPVRVLFDYGAGVTKEAQVISASSTQIQVISPSVDLGTGQTKTATIKVISNAGSPTETPVTSSTTLTYQAEVLTPKITTVSPASGPIDGGTRVTIFGEGFQMPVQVFFGSAEAQVINVTFNQIIVMSPTARDTATDASGAVTGPVPIRIVNINSATSVTANDAFRYVAKSQITAMGPTEGPYTGGTQVRIDGTGFNDPVAVVIGGVAAQVIKVTPTQILAITSPVQPTSCGDVTGPSSVTNIDNGDSAAGVAFIYRVPKPIIVGVSPNQVAAGGTVQVTIANASGIPRLSIGDTGISITGATIDATSGLTTLTGLAPTTLQLATNVCAGVTRPIPTSFDVTYTSATTTCSDTLKKGLTVTPAGYGSAILSLIPTSFTPMSARFTAASGCTTTTNPGPPPTTTTTCTSPATITPSAPQTISIVNTGIAPLTINNVTTTCTRFTVVPPAAGTVIGECDNAGLAVSYNGPVLTSPAIATSLATATTNPTSETCTVTILTNAGNKTLTVSGSTQ